MKAIAHPIDIFSLAVTGKQILSASGASSIKVHSTTDPDFPLVQSIEGAHKVGCHHIVTDAQGSRAVSVGFGGDVKIWTCNDGTWSEDRSFSGMYFLARERVQSNRTDFDVRAYRKFGKRDLGPGFVK